MAEQGPELRGLSLPGTMPKRFIARSVTRQGCACQSGVIPAANPGRQFLVSRKVVAAVGRATAKPAIR
jgi:hypothetical protein